MDDFQFDATEFGSRIRKAIEEATLSLNDAALMLNVPYSRVSEYVNGKRIPPVPRLLEIVHTLGLDIRTLFPSREPEPQYLATMTATPDGAGAACSIEKV